MESKRGRMEEKRVFVKLDLELYREKGDSVAVLYAFLCNASKIWKKDNDGYFEIFQKYIREQLGWSNDRFYKARDTLIEVGLLQVRQGVNQNKNTKYKLT
jgi:hypothetical protein